MNASPHRAQLAALDDLTGPLMGRVRQLSRRVDQLLVTAIRRPPQPDLCAWCSALPGGCELSGGTQPCEGLDEYLAYEAQSATAPVIVVPFRAGAR